jgi:hypothetical protein
VTPETPCAKDLRTWIEAAVENSLTREQLNGLVSLCHSLATIALRHKFIRAALHSTVQSSDYRDLAYDCIAELFQRGEDGSLLQVKAYFEGVNHVGASDQELLAHLRRIVFTKVNHGVARFYGEMDPALSKILRNIKLSIQALHNFEVVERFGEPYMASALCSTLEELPSFEPREIENQLRRSANADEHIPAILAKLSQILRQQEEHRRLLPLMTVALVIKSIYSSPYKNLPDSTEAGDLFTAEDASLVVQAACRELLSKTSPKYVERGKVERDVFEKYFKVIQESVVERLIGRNGEFRSLFSGLQSLIPSMSESEYKRKHRAKIEYLARLAYKTSINKLRRNS